MGPLGILTAGMIRICGCILLVPFLLMTLLPAAVMPMQAANGTVMLVLCTGDGPVEMAVDLGSAPDDTATSPRCDWATHAASAVLPEIIQAIRPAAYTRHAMAMTADLVAPAHDPHGVMARGPPATL